MPECDFAHEQNESVGVNFALFGRRHFARLGPNSLGSASILFA